MKALIACLTVGCMMAVILNCNPGSSSSDTKTAFGRVYNSTSYSIYNLKIGTTTYPTIGSYQWSPSMSVPMGSQAQSWTWNGLSYSQTANIAGDFNAYYYGGYSYTYSIESEMTSVENEPASEMTQTEE
jgi:hypothetical protein